MRRICFSTGQAESSSEVPSLQTTTDHLSAADAPEAVASSQSSIAWAVVSQLRNPRPAAEAAWRSASTASELDATRASTDNRCPRSKLESGVRIAPFGDYSCVAMEKSLTPSRIRTRREARYDVSPSAGLPEQA
eukprot:scaffold181800_cov42-Prasinocladus_malaysianus.AAC.2